MAQIAPAVPRRRTIVCLTTQRWSDGMWTNKQHVMSRLARDHRVLYVNFGALSPERLAPRKLRAGPGALLRPARFLVDPLVERDRGVEILDFFTVPKWSFLPAAARMGLTADTQTHLLGRWLARQGITDAILWVYHPAYGAGPARLPHSLLVYDCVDEYSAFPAFAEARAWITAREAALCQAADLVFCTAPALLLAKRPYNPAGTHLVHNVGDAEHFAQARDPALPLPADVAHLPRPVIGFVGAVSNYKVDLDQVEHLARARPGWSVVLVGEAGVGDPGTNLARLRALPNVHLLGHREYATLPAYLKAFDVAVIPYRINEYTRAVFPLKFFDFLASGKPVVIAPLPALERYWPLVRVAATGEALVQAAEDALADPGAGREARIAAAEEHTWPARVGKMMALVERSLERLDAPPRGN